jgi:hypothetical protein
MKFDMHFVINEKLLKRLDKMTEKMNLKTRSATIVAIFNLFLPYLEKKQIKFKNNESKYRLVADLKETRRHVHAYVPEEVYRRLKELHEYSNFYSIAQILREIIRIYLKECFKLGIEEAVSKLEKLKKKWEMMKKMRQGKIFLRQLHVKNRSSSSISITYDRFFHPLSIKFLS